MDLEEFRAKWNDPEFQKSYADLDQEPPATILERMRRMHERAKRVRRTRRMLVKVSLAVLLGLAAVQLYVRESREQPLQAAAYMIELAIVYALQKMDQAREKYRLPKLWLNLAEFPPDEYHRLGKNISFARWNTALVSVAIVCVPLYAAPMLSARLQIACYAVAAAAVLGLLIYDYRRIADLKSQRDSLRAELEEPELLP